MRAVSDPRLYSNCKDWQIGRSLRTGTHCRDGDAERVAVGVDARDSTPTLSGAVAAMAGRLSAPDGASVGGGNTSSVRHSLACLDLQILEALVDVLVFAHADVRIMRAKQPTAFQKAHQRIKGTGRACKTSHLPHTTRQSCAGDADIKCSGMWPHSIGFMHRD